MESGHPAFGIRNPQLAWIPLHGANRFKINRSGNCKEQRVHFLREGEGWTIPQPPPPQKENSVQIPRVLLSGSFSNFRAVPTELRA